MEHKEVWKDCEIHPEGCYKTVCDDCGMVTYRDCDEVVGEGE
jgi:hypothetical protein